MAEGNFIRLVRRYGKRADEVEESLKNEMIRITVDNPPETYYLSKKRFYELLRKQAEFELKESVYGFHARGIKGSKG